MRRILGALLGACLASLPLVGGAQQLPVPTEDQLEVLRNMSPDDREALMRDLGLGRDNSGQSDSGSRQNNNRQRDGEGLQQGRGGQMAPAIILDDKSLKSDDSILVEVALPTGKPERVVPQAQGLPPVTLPAEPPPELTPDEELALKKVTEAILSKNPYQLNGEGALELPGFPPVVLAGLDEEQAAKRLKAIYSLRQLDITVVRLPVRKVGVAALKPFGYDLFKGSPSTFAPITDVPVPADYVVGAGDQLSVQLFGGQNRTFKLTVSRDGRISFPQLGPINVAGRTFSAVAADLEARVARQMIGTRASVTMGDTRAIRVFVLGEANRPGSSTVSGLATVTSALFAAGGVKPIGSLRNIQLKRQGAVVRTLDLYDLLIRGDTSDDAKLLPGDAIFIPPIGPTVAIDGEVRRPAIYELKGDVPVEAAVALAGGLTPEADPTRVAVVRVDEQLSRVVVDVPLRSASNTGATLLRQGDSMRVLKLRPTLDSGVVLDGHVFQPGMVAWREGLRVSDVIHSIDELRPNADLNYVLIRRETPPERRQVAVSVDLAKALRQPGSDADVLLRPRDRIVVFDLSSDRHEIIAPLLEEMRRQSTADLPTEVVSVEGRVKAAGEYPLEPGMRVSDLLRAGGGLQAAAYTGQAELTRYGMRAEGRTTELIDIDLRAVLAGDVSADIHLQPFDFLNIKEVPEWSEQEKVELSGEVKFPGFYPITRGETLSSVIARAGGLTSLAFPEGAVFTRIDLRKREQLQLDRLAERLQADMAVAALQAAHANQGAATQALPLGQSLLTQLKATKAIGRLVIDLPDLARGRGTSADVLLRDGDQLLVPKQTQEVTVIGEVQTATSHLFRAELSRDDYIQLSGGLTRKADRGRIYIVRADGSVISGENSGWFRRSGQVAIKAGDTIVAPLDTERLPPLPLWQAVTQILYNLAISAAAVQSF